MLAISNYSPDDVMETAVHVPHSNNAIPCYIVTKGNSTYVYRFTYYCFVTITLGTIC